MLPDILYDRPSLKNLFQILLYLACSLLVVIYANLFSLYQAINTYLGSTFIAIAPFAAIPLLLVPLILRSIGSRTEPVSRVPLWLGLLLVIFALILPDPGYPVKRIHVAEYLLLSLVVRYALSMRLHSNELLFFSIGFCILLGIHDECIQGLLPARTYGLRDMTVNAVSATGGCCIWHGLRISGFTKSDAQSETQPLPRLYLLWLTTAVIGFILPQSVYLGTNLPLWTILPLLATGVIWSTYSRTFAESSWGHGVNLLSLAALLLLVYPLAGRVLNTVFH